MTLRMIAKLERHAVTAEMMRGECVRRGLERQTGLWNARMTRIHIAIVQLKWRHVNRTGDLSILAT